MKLYTEEQVRRAMYEVCDYYVREYQDEILASLTPIELPKYDNVTRFEVIDHSSKMRGRYVVEYGVKVEVSIQDEGRTMKVFLTDQNK